MATPDVEEKQATKLQEPKKYAVILLNDDYTPADIVVKILMSIFKKSQSEAIHLTNCVHNKGQCIAGVYTYEIAESKVHEVKSVAKHYEVPFRSTMEPTE